ncbi:MAG: hypothetical protein J6A70_01105 [Prevotella sp.]|nr:hypothetical protein [Prevotella sp.]
MINIFNNTHIRSWGKYILALFGLPTLIGCVQDIPKLAQGNKWELYSTLAYYKYIDRDTLKYKAACFLIENMPYHYSQKRIYKDNDTLKLWLHETDSIYYSIVKGHKMDNFPWDTLRHIKNARREIIEADTLPDPVIAYNMLCDINELEFDFLTDHIDNAFRVWHESPFARNLTFEQFKEYILPYSSVNGYGFNETGKTYYDLFAKYVMSDSTADLRTTIQYYNAAINNLRDMNGKTHRTVLAGVYDLYSRDFHDCVDVASYGCNILRACGLPVVVEHNICYRSLSGRHYHCSVYNDSTDTWQTFNAESSLPGDGDWAFAETANVYRSTYAAQKDTPPFLKAEGEYVPSVLDDPCMKDVTAYLAKTVSITLPFHESTKCNLAYLATYSRDWQGAIPVTWGVIDRSRGEVTFNHAMPGVLYFPVYYPNESYRTFGQPFYIEMDDSVTVIREIPYIDENDTSRTSVTLMRKYPRKPNMERVAEELIGGRFIGSRKGDFSDAVTLLEIKEAPQPALLTYPLSHVGRYKSYRFQASEENNHAHISMLEWLTPESYGYTNTMPAKRRHVLSPSDTMAVNGEKHLVRLMDAEKWDDMSWKAEYDGNMQTAPSAYPNITLKLKEPQMVTHVRFSPKNADNGICAGDEYELRYWDDGWMSCGTAKAEYEYIEFNNVPHGKLYWLVNLSHGKEEMPFVLDEQAQQRFVYYDIMDIDKN